MPWAVIACAAVQSLAKSDIEIRKHYQAKAINSFGGSAKSNENGWKCSGCNATNASDVGQCPWCRSYNVKDRESAKEIQLELQQFTMQKQCAEMQLHTAQVAMQSHNNPLSQNAYHMSPGNLFHGNPGMPLYGNPYGNQSQWAYHVHAEANQAALNVAPRAARSEPPCAGSQQAGDDPKWETGTKWYSYGRIMGLLTMGSLVAMIEWLLLRMI